MKATVYEISPSLAVAYLRDETGAYVAECKATGEGWEVLPQSVRPIVGVVETELGVRDEASAQDHVDRATLGIERFRARLRELDAAVLVNGDTAALVDAVQAVKHELVALCDRLHWRGAA